MALFQPSRLREFEGRMFSGLLLLLLGFVPVLSGAFYILHDLVREEREFVEHRTREIILTERLNVNYERTLSLVPVYVLTRRSEILDQLRTARASILSNIAELDGMATEAEEHSALSAIRDLNARMSEIAERGIEMRLAGASSEKVNDFFRWRASDYTLQLQDRLGKFTHRQGVELEKARVALADTAKEAVVGLAIVSVLTLLFLGVVTTLLIRELRRKRRLDKEQGRLLMREREISLLRKENVDVVSHDLKNPIAALKLRIQLIGRRGPGEDLNKDVKLALQSVNSMETLVRDLLDHAKIDAGHLALAPRACTVAELIDAAVARVEPLAQDKGVILSSYEEPGFPTVDCDPARIAQVLDNLIGNALKFTPRGGSIRVSASFQSRQWMISVADTGPGIPAEHLPRVFERFWQETATAKKGNGLGLAIAKGIIESHGGRIWAESRPGQGAEFFFTMPFEARAPLTEAPSRHTTTA
jgi:signal transduction histidine kinase